MTITALLSKDQGPLYSGPFSSLASNASPAFFKASSERKLGSFPRPARVAIKTVQRASRAVSRDRACSAAPLLPKARGAAPTMPADFSPSAPSERAASPCIAPAMTVTVATLDEKDRGVGSVDDRMRRSNRHGGHRECRH